MFVVYTCLAPLRYGRYDDAEDAILRNLDVNLERTQSKIALLGLYYSSDNRTKLAAQLQDADWIKDVPARHLMLCAAKLGQKNLPAAVIDQLTSSLQGTPRRNIGRPGDFVIAVSPSWQIQNATVALNWGDREFTNPRLLSGGESVLLSFDGVTESGNPLTSISEKGDVSLTVKYPDTPPVRLSLKSKPEEARPLDISNLKLVGSQLDEALVLQQTLTQIIRRDEAVK